MGKYKRLLQNHEYLKAQLEQIKEQLRISGSRNQMLQSEADTLRQLLMEAATENEKLENKIKATRLSVERKTGQCDGCVNRKITQRCASCTRNPHARDKYCNEDTASVKTAADLLDNRPFKSRTGERCGDE